MTRFALTKFKSCRETAIHLAPLTVMIGANASGKSNVIEGLRLLSWLARGRELEEVLRAARSRELVLRGVGPSDFALDKELVFGFGCTVSHELLEGYEDFSVRISIEGDQLRVVDERVRNAQAAVPLYEIAHGASGLSHDIQVAYDNFARGGRKPQITCTDRQIILTQLRTPAGFDAAHKRSQYLIPTVADTILYSLARTVFLDPVPGLMRGYAHLAERTLDEKGQFVSSVLCDLCKEAQDKARVLEFIRDLPEQDIADIRFYRTERGETMAQLVETFAGREVTRDAPVLSDGTLRVLAVAAALLSAPEGALVVIEEIDNGVHPSRAGRLLDNILSTAKRRWLRVLLTTHNPALVDALPAEAVPDVTYCYRDPADGWTRLARLQDLPSYPELVAQGPLGRLMTERVIERFVKDARSEDEKTREKLDWLARMERVGK